MNEKYEEQHQVLTKTSTGFIYFQAKSKNLTNIFDLERDVIRNEIKAVTEMFEKQTIENGKSNRRCSTL